MINPSELFFLRLSQDKQLCILEAAKFGLRYEDVLAEMDLSDDEADSLTKAISNHLDGEDA